ncbi:hypothetical protein [Alkalicoccus urumqiensis]|uniref:Uncharacterized protein n=1 Tax=Alkalicoccus urumqiensis TaxID=1548213 RepID=A0A2P6MGP2_ALKUR|nr:hypothetical protein [Alkalicoccus urumqiensis]PRO65437.1 hypothetical protein C6I21_09775 [Alkalicoccus urumqiensis]
MTVQTEQISYQLMKEIYNHCGREELLEKAVSMLPSGLPPVRWCSFSCDGHSTPLFSYPDSEPAEGVDLYFNVGGGTMHLKVERPLQSDEKKQLKELAEALDSWISYRF